MSYPFLGLCPRVAGGPEGCRSDPLTRFLDGSTVSETPQPEIRQFLELPVAQQHYQLARYSRQRGALRARGVVAWRVAKPTVVDPGAGAPALITVSRVR